MMLKTVTDNANAGMPEEQARRAGYAQTNLLVTQHRGDLVRAPDAALMTHVARSMRCWPGWASRNARASS